MLSREDRVWLAREYPELTPTRFAVNGLIKFTAAYHQESERFFILHHEPTWAEIGVVLSGAFEIRICGQLDSKTTSLPKLFVDGVPHTLDHHFYQNDFSACLCSPLQHEDFLVPAFEFRKFFNELVIPFLYGHVFLSTYGKWPWAEFAHGATGIVEAYASGSGRRKTQQCISILAQDRDWNRIKSILRQESPVDVNLPCVCGSREIVGRCHPKALKGFRLLQKDLRLWPVALP